MALGTSAAHAQQATISPSSARGAEHENLEFTLSSSWRYDVEIEYFTEDISATAGEDYRSEGWHFCFQGEDDLDGASEGCEFGAGYRSYTIPVVHYNDDVRESDETYRLVARILRWDTGEVASAPSPPPPRGIVAALAVRRRPVTPRPRLRAARSRNGG